MAPAVSIELLKRIDVFKGLTDRELARIAELCREHSHGAGEICVAEGDKADYLRFVKKGRVAIEFRVPHAPEGKDITVDTVGAGEVFAWSALVTGTMTASVKTVEPTEVLDVSASELLSLCEEDNHIGYTIMKNLTWVISSRLTRSRLALLNAISAAIGEGW